MNPAPLSELTLFHPSNVEGHYDDGRYLNALMHALIYSYSAMMIDDHLKMPASPNPEPDPRGPRFSDRGNF